MTKTYQYTGKDQISLVGHGIVNPGDVIETVTEINHPEFIEEKKTDRAEKNTKGSRV